MCGRYSLEFDEGFYKRYQLSHTPVVKTTYNAAPGQMLPVVVSHSPNTLEYMQWGLVPFWEEEKEKPRGLINVRRDTVMEKTWAQKYIRFQRCLVPATGFYEWKQGTTEKQPYYIRTKHEKYYAFAGVYGEHTLPRHDKVIKTFAILTTEPNTLMKTIHHRMPIILRQKDEDRWLDHDLTEMETIAKLLYQYPDSDMEAYPISLRINSLANNDSALLAKIPEQEAMF